ncbi:1,4-alpha-glucan branching protein GlgB [Chryseobacterium chendengshani]|uniref:1,4-alpha-glucan branching protein GlgB n=1 Tax=Chryseobacterium sp. LJ756 TaxID=2864113 RepID=UPI001C63BB12|nr:1,4-alpha-glucan branching protein GlgB [Chryseobacterium sp. LJ756]MBW7674681.1 1,4-alpha-glucan branching protein GlgB [Chryseobacterium sp. LJ756]
MNSVKTYTLFTDHDVYLFKEGKHYKLYEKFGAHSVEKDGIQGVYFSVWAPNAKKVSVIGNFNNWNHKDHILFPRWDGSGIWEGFIAGLTWGTLYKYAIENLGKILEKSDPYALSWEQNLQAASLVSTTWYEWSDKEWLEKRWKNNSLNSPISVYELHLGSWFRNADVPDKFLNYRDIGEKLVPYIKYMGFTHVEFMPLMEFPYDPSWGYQITGFFAATSRFGSPQDLMFLINELHKNEIGVILDWVPSHFPGDANGLHRFDGSYLYEPEDQRRGFHPEWKSYIFNYGRNEVKSFLISNAMFWLDRYHADGLRVDAVTSMLHLDYSRNEGEWEPNIYGENVNLEAKLFLQEFNTAVYKEFGESIITIAEESSDFPLLTKPVHDGGVGFGMKWMMGWMHDTLDYFKEEYENRKYKHHKLTFASMYMYNENYMMPLSHDEVVHGKASLIYKMKGDEWQKFANLRALFVYMFTHPGAKLLFMGDEFGQTSEWNFKQSLDWHLLDFPIHKGLQNLVKDLNHLYTTETAFYENQFNTNGFEWVEADDTGNSVLIYLRKGNKKDDVLMVILNLTPQAFDYKVGVNAATHWEVIFNSDDKKYDGSGVEPTVFKEEKDEWMNRPQSISLKLPPLAGLVLKMKKEKKYKIQRIKQHKK